MSSLGFALMYRTSANKKMGVSINEDLRPQRYPELGDWAMIVQYNSGIHNAGRDNGKIGQLVDYGIPGGSFRLESNEKLFNDIYHHEDLFLFEWEWSGT